MHGSAQADHVDLAGLVLSERRNAEAGVEQDIRRPARELKDLPGAEVAVHVRAGGEGRPRPAVHVASGDGAATVRVWIRGDRIGEAARIAERGIEVGAARALPDSPAIV